LGVLTVDESRELLDLPDLISIDPNARP
jgi:hypothetical protein